jgi:acetyltransferase-like isoleucine patch superfamily enzyme
MQNPATEHVPGVDPMRDIEEFYKQHDALYERPAPVSLTDCVKRPERNYDFYEPIIVTKPERVTIYPKARIDSFVKIEGGEGVVIGRYVHIASFAHLNIGGGTLLIMDFAAVASGAKLISGSNQLDALSMSASAPAGLMDIQKKITKLMQYSVVLVNSVVLPGVTLHEGAVLAAGGVATKDIPAWEVWGGVPARFMFKREVKK